MDIIRRPHPLLVLAAYVNGCTIRDPARPDATRALPRLRVQLRRRGDLAHHFTASAALAAHGGDALADLVGLYKEVSDAHSGSGFSFADMTPDRAGVRFAELATGSRAVARYVQGFAERGLKKGPLHAGHRGPARGHRLGRDAAHLWRDRRHPLSAPGRAHQGADRPADPVSGFGRPR